MIAHRSNHMANGQAGRQLSAEEEKKSYSLYTRLRDDGIAMSLDEIRTRFATSTLTGAWHATRCGCDSRMP
jgi:hypothetical protein